MQGMIFLSGGMVHSDSWMITEDAMTPSERFKLTEKAVLWDVHPDGYLVDHTLSSNKKGMGPW